MPKYTYVIWRKNTSVGNNIIGLTEKIKNITAVKVNSSVTCDLILFTVLQQIPTFIQLAELSRANVHVI